jgi:acyl-CoA thioester hydrolase
MVTDAALRYRAPARYDDPIRVRTWVREVASRRVTFGYAVEHDESGQLLVTASTALVVLDARSAFARLPADVRARLLPIDDPVRL